jgi:chemotaxis protein MotB
MGVSDERFDSVVGKADTEPFNKDNPLSPQNRRISILLLKST